MKTLGRQIQEARKMKHMSQSELARRIGCKQSALSMYESGRTTALSAEAVGKICQELGLLPPTQVELTSESEKKNTVRSFCPNVECVSNLPLKVGEKVVYVPRGHIIEDGECHCAWCGEVLEKQCPECGAQIHAGAFCRSCGTPYLTGDRLTGNDHTSMAQHLMAWSEIHA